ncbi:hypothetical protein PENTCL1PPCAC_662, partial [Pristionchus entomophagus]
QSGAYTSRQTTYTMAASSFFHGKSVIVTGSSNGIGRETARMFAELGAKVTITGRNSETLNATKKLCLDSGAFEANILEIVADLEADDTPKRLVDETVRAFGGIDVLVNNAGMALADSEGRTAMDVPMDVYDRTMSVNLRSVLVLTNLAVPYLEKRQGAVVNVSSIAGLPFGMTDFYYPVSKAALDQLTVQLAHALITKDIRVNSVNPGLVKTDIVRKMAGEEVSDALFASGTNRDVIPLGRVGVPADIAKLIVFLSDRSQSEFIVGQRIAIDGGSVLKNALLSKGI